MQICNTITRPQALAIAAYHAKMAMEHYLSGELEEYARHILIHDKLLIRAAWI